MNKHIRPLTGLRFVAAAVVLLHHFIAAFFIELRSFPLGAPAVGFFFVLSGFILTYVYHDKLRRDNIGRFYISRIARIWPLHLTCLAIMFAFIVSRPVYEFTTDQAIALFCHAFLIQTYVPVADFVFQFNGLAWSVSVECFFYTLFPFLLWLNPKRAWTLPAVVLGGTTIGLFVLQFAQTNQWLPAFVDLDVVAHCNPLFRLAEFTVGIWIGRIFIANAGQLAERQPRFWRDTAIEVVTVLVFVGFLYTGYTVVRVQHVVGELPYSGEVFASWIKYSLAFPVSALMIHVFARTRGAIASVLSTPLMVLFGETSYALYLVQMIFIRYFRGLLGLFADPPFWFMFLIVLSLTVGASIVLHRFVELPGKSLILSLGSRDWPYLKTAWRQFTRDSWAHGSFALAVILIAIGVVGTLQVQKFRPEFEPEIRRIIASSEPLLRNAKFVNEATLFGVVTEDHPEGLKVRFVWQLEDESQRARTVHVLGPNEEVLETVQLSNHELRKLPGGKYLVDSVIIPKQQLTGATSLAVSFQAPGQRMARVIVRDRTRRIGNRLRFVDIVDIHPDDR